MKKLLWILGLLVLIGGAWAVAVFLAGNRMEKNYYAVLNEISAHGGISLASTDYRRGFLHSRAVTEVRLDLPLPEQYANWGKLRLQLVHDLLHGPLPVGRTSDGRWHWRPLLAMVETRISGDAGAGVDLLQEIPELADARSYTIVDLTGGIQSRFDIPAFSRSLAESNGTLAWGGLEGNLRTSVKFANLRGNLRLPKVEFASPAAGARLEEAQSSFRLDKAFEFLYLGEMESRFGTLEVRLPPEETTGVVALRDFQVTTASRRDGDLVQYAEVIQLGNLMVGKQTFGPGRLELQIRNVDGPALAKFVNQIQTVQKNPGNQEEVAADMQDSVFALLEGLSGRSPELHIREFQVTTPQGKIEGSGLLRLTGEERLSRENLSSAISRLHAEAEVKVPRELLTRIVASFVRDRLEKSAGGRGQPGLSGTEMETVAGKQAEMLLAMWEQQNLLVTEGDGMKVSVVFQQGEFSVNGKPFGTGN